MTAYLPILTMICLVVLFIAASFTASQLLGPRRPNAAKQAPYESGIVPEQEPSERFPVKFYLVAMTFIVLDVEIIFLYPFTTIFRNFVPAAYGLAIMGVFLLTLLVPFACAKPRAIARPRPAPPMSPLPRRNGSNIASRSADATPGPASSTCRRSSPPRSSTRIRTGAPGGENFNALSSRLTSARSI